MMQDQLGAGGRVQPSAPARPATTDPAGPMDPADLQSAFDNAPVAMAVVTPFGVVTTCNPALGGLLGVDPRAMLGSTLFDVTHPDDLHEAYRQCALMQAGTAQIVRHECRLLQSDGTVIWVLVSTSRVPEVSERPAHLIMHIEDITDRKALEAELTHQALPRSDRATKPGPAARPDRPRPGPQSTQHPADLPVLPGPQRLQIRQRHPRPRLRRPGAAATRPAAHRDAPSGGHGRTPGRRRVHRALRRPRTRSSRTRRRTSAGRCRRAVHRPWPPSTAHRCSGDQHLSPPVREQRSSGTSAARRPAHVPRQTRQPHLRAHGS